MKQTDEKRKQRQNDDDDNDDEGGFFNRDRKNPGKRKGGFLGDLFDFG